jgi:phosphomannomutase/phosphoglucomutase
MTQTIPQNIFRTYDIRGLAETELTTDFVRTLGLACGRFFLEHGEDRVVVGRDNRLSSDRIFADLTAGLTAAGCAIIDLGVTVTPLFYYARIHWNINAGVMITASHNPSGFNGFKIALGDGTIYGEQIQRLRIDCERLRMTSKGMGPPVRYEKINPRMAYLAMLRRKIRLGPRRLRVAVDCGNGAAGLYAEELLASLGCEVFPIYCESDGRFPHHHPDPVKRTNLQALARLVQNEQCDLGIAFDGDGDRLGVVDEQGRMVRGDRLMVLFWREILAKHPGVDCIVEVKCSKALLEEIERLGGKPRFHQTGHSLIKASMRASGALFAGEMSGHMFFADEYYGYDDALYAAARLLRILSRTEMSITDMLQDLPDYPSTGETHVPCDDRRKFHVVRELTERLRKAYSIIDVDGVRVLFPEGWALARASNTEPAIITRCEGETRQALDFICSFMKNELLRFSEVKAFEWEK